MHSPETTSKPCGNGLASTGLPIAGPEIREQQQPTSCDSSDILSGKKWHIHHGDCISHMMDLDDDQFDFSVFSPPFPSLYAYTDSECDIGNSDDLRSEAKLHLSFFYRQLARVVKPGRVIVVHVAQIPRMARSGGRGLFDFRGMNIRLGERSRTTQHRTCVACLRRTDDAVWGCCMKLYIDLSSRHKELLKEDNA